MKGKNLNNPERTPGILSVRRSPRSQTHAIAHFASMRFPAIIGRGGVTSHKREGDGATPRAPMRLRYGFYRADRVARPVTRLPMRAIRADDGWCDAPGHPAYNTPVRLPFSASHERLMREDRLYDVCIVLDWNLTERRRNAGSAIFLHQTSPDGTPTAGCIALDPAALRLVLAHAGQETLVVVE
ncbi:L,D-transpeptidase family protein [Pararhizobium mangrovi]|uniref:L,D-TPase catalytic domain-containing protein n=1 Tax=Pararhizobium mangrovi TaxID=2590452 RepID=A0A506U5B8_9HYPH|nr:L,D-transpeptidase family protein [Pararhizobium mangrovi]TPW27749.1 hypothetical protein FJU11_10970 [Pararhizobium mangrovi]